MRTTAVPLAASLAFTVAAAALMAQAPATPQPTFRAGVELVQVDVSVLDTDRRPVRGLTAADFTVTEDGKTRPVVAFTAIDLPASSPGDEAPWLREVAADAVTNAIPREGRLVVILFDRTIGIADMPEARRAAQAAVDALGPADLGAVIYTARGVPQNFTGDRQLLRSAIDRPFMGLSDVDLVGADGLSSREVDNQVERGNPGECRCGVCPLEAMTRVAESLRDVPQRRKMLLFLGSSLPVESSGPCGSDVKEARTKLFRAAGVANLAIHTFDSNGLETLAPRADVGGAGRPPAMGGNLRRQGDLAVYRDRTGGRAVQNTNAPASAIPAIFAESSSYYVLGFEPVSPKRDGRFHEIKVAVTRRDVSVHPRQGYYAPSDRVRADTRSSPKDGPSPSLVSALAGLWPDTGIPVSVTVAPFATPGKSESTVSVVMHAREPLRNEGDSGPAPGGATGVQRVNVLAGAYDRTGKSLDFNVQSIEVTPPASARTAVEYEVSSVLTLKPGRHEIRVAAENLTRGTSGSVYTYVDVPDFSKSTLALSGAVLGVSGGRQPAGRLGEVLPFTPIAQRTFSAADRVAAFVRVYQGGTGAAAPVTLTARILDAGNQAVFEQRTPVFDNRGSAPRSGDYQVDLPLAQLKPGEYLLKVDAGGQTPSATRNVRFTVR